HSEFPGGPGVRICDGRELERRRRFHGLAVSSKPPAMVLWPVSSNIPIEKLSNFMTAAAETSALEARVGHYYQMDGTYLVGREKVREYARAVQDYHPAHWDVAAAEELG